MNDLYNQDENKEKMPQIPYAVVNQYTAGLNIAEGPRIRARCIAPEGLFYRYNRIREGEEFTIYPIYSARRDKNGKLVKENGQPKLMLIPAKNQFSKETMELVEENTSRGDSFSGAQQAINKAVEELNAAKAPVEREK